MLLAAGQGTYIFLSLYVFTFHQSRTNLSGLFVHRISLSLWLKIDEFYQLTYTYHCLLDL